MSETRGVLVTGATGFVGRRLVSALLTQTSWRVVAAVRREVPLPAGATTFRIQTLGPATAWAPGLTDYDAVVHLAARVHMVKDHSADSLADYRAVNVAGTLALAEQAATAGVRRFVFISSIKVNGESSLRGRPFTEQDPPGPADPYGISKAEAEAGLFSLGARTGMEIVIIRPPLVYGPGVKANFLSMIRWIARGVPLPLGGIRDNRRSLVGLDNLVDLILICLERPEAANEVFFAGDGEDLSTADLLMRTGAALGMRARLFPVPSSVLSASALILGKRHVLQRLCGTLQVDIAKARRVLGWSPRFSIDEELRRTVAALGSDVRAD